MNDEALIKFCFSIFDIDKGGSLDMAELDALVRMLTGEDEIRGELKKSLDNIDADGDGEVSLEEMYGYNKEFPQLLKPAFDLRDNLMLQIYGRSFLERFNEFAYFSVWAHGILRGNIAIGKEEKKAELAELAAKKKAEEDAKQAEIDAKKAAEEKARLAAIREEEVRMKAAETETETELREALDDLKRCTSALENFRQRTGRRGGIGRERGCRRD